MEKLIIYLWYLHVSYDSKVYLRAANKTDLSFWMQISEKRDNKVSQDGWDQRVISIDQRIIFCRKNQLQRKGNSIWRIWVFIVNVDSLKMVSFIYINMKGNVSLKLKKTISLR